MKTVRTRRIGTILLTCGLVALAAALLAPTAALAGERDGRGGPGPGPGGGHYDGGRGWHGNVDVHVGRPASYHPPYRPVYPGYYRPYYSYPHYAGVVVVNPAPSSYWVSGYYGTQYQTVEVAPGYYESRPVSVWVPGYYATAPVYRTWSVGASVRW